MNYEQNPFFQMFGPQGYYDMALADEERTVSGLQPGTETHQFLERTGFFDVPAVREWVAALSRPERAAPDGNIATDEAQPTSGAYPGRLSAFRAALDAVRGLFVPAACRQEPPRPFLATINGRRTYAARNLAR